MMDIFESIACLTCKDAKAASCYADQITAESRKDGRWTPFLTDFSALLHHKNSLVRNRVISILAANAKWTSSE